MALTNGKRVCITRLIGAIDIPFERSNASEFLVRRFVGLLPVVRNGGECTKLGGVWLTNEVQKFVHIHDLLYDNVEYFFHLKINHLKYFVFYS